MKVSLVKDAINTNVLIIEEEHFDNLNKLVAQFEKFNFGKKKLVELRHQSAHQVEEIGVNEETVRIVIGQNKIVKDQYDQLIKDLAKSFRRQIKG